MAVKVKRERPDQRRHHRVTAPLFVDVGGVRLRAADWSLGGLRIEDHPGPVPEVGALLPISLTLPFQGFEVSFDAKATVVRNDPAATLERVWNAAAATNGRQPLTRDHESRARSD